MQNKTMAPHEEDRHHGLLSLTLLRRPSKTRRLLDELAKSGVPENPTIEETIQRCERIYRAASQPSVK